MSRLPEPNIIVNDFDRLKARIRSEIAGHRIDLCMAAIYSVQKELEVEYAASIFIKPDDDKASQHTTNPETPCPK
jgi:hypothetical protein